MSLSDPLMPSAAYKTYAILQPIETHFRSATCEEARCGPYVNGWKSIIDETTEIGQKRAYYIRKLSGRRFVEERVGLGLTTFTFAPGQSCFRSDEHQVLVGREPLFLVRGGDRRANPRGDRRQHKRAADWVDDFAEHQDRIARAIEKG